MNRFSLKYQIALVVFLLQIILLGVLLWKTFDMMRISTEKQLEMKAKSVLFWVDEASHVAFVKEEYDDLQSYVSDLSKDPMVALVRIADRKNRILVSTNQAEVGTIFPAPGKQDNPLEMTRDIINPAGKLGRLSITLSDTALKQDNVGIRNTAILIAFVGAFLSACIGMLVGHLLTRRLNVLDGMARQVTAGNYDISIDMSGEDEVGRLGLLFKQMVDSVKGSIGGLRDSTRRLELATASGGIGIWEWDIQSNVLNWDDRVLELYGVSRGSFTSCLEAWEKGLHPDDRAAAIENTQSALRGEKEYATEFRVVHPDGKVKFLQADAIVIRDTDGKALRMIGMNRDITERKLAEEVVKESEKKFRLIFDNANDGVLLADIESMKLEMGNRMICEMLGYSEAEIPRLRVLDIHPEKDLPDVLARFQGVVTGEIHMATDIPVKRKDGSVFYADINSSLITFGDRRCLMGHFRDVTRERVLREQLQTAQKMEAVGNLAGGIAHDFNNALTGIFGFGEMLKSQLSGNERAASNLNEILRCAERAATLTRQLLTYARRQIIEPVNLDLNAVITDLTKLISTVVGEHIEIRTFLAKDLPTIRADRGQIEQVLMNLALNARDAMAGGGQLLIETEVVNLDAEYVCYHPYMSVGSYVNLAVSDTGTGMDVKTQERVFEPFFTTKGPDKGTGLGLAMVYGIVKQNDGFIHLYSEPGKGTTFKIYLPPVEAVPDVTISSKPSEIRGGTETILLAEDNESVRMLEERTLTELGYTVLVARNGEEAVETFKSKREKIDLVILDMVMPRKGGKEAYEELHRTSPDLKVIFTSGYTVNTVHESFVLIAGVPFLVKPFGPGELARKVREVLDM